MAFRVELPLFRGPLDLLLYLVKQHELDVLEVPLAGIADQYLEYLALLEPLDVDAVGDFLEMASFLMELKSRLVLPQAPDEEQPWEDPREELVARLLEYKKYRDVASMLEERSREWQQSYPRLARDLPPRQVDPGQQPIREVELWDLVSAFGRVMRQHQRPAEASIIYDDTPIQVHMQMIYHHLSAQGSMRLSDLLQAGMSKSAVIGIFLAVLELVRHHSVEAEQVEGEGDILVRPGIHFDRTLQLQLAADPYAPDSQRPDSQRPDSQRPDSQRPDSQGKDAADAC